MNLQRTLPALVIAAALPAVGCADAEPAPEFAPAICDLSSCVDDPDAPIALAKNGVLWLSVSADPHDEFSVRASDPDLLSITAVGYDVEVRGLAVGPVDLELVDGDGDVIDSVELTVIAPTRLRASMRWVEDGAQHLEPNVPAYAPLTVPANAAVGITVTPFLGSFELAGLIDYEITTTLPTGASLDTSGLSEDILLMKTGEHIVTYRTGSLEQTFMLETP